MASNSNLPQEIIADILTRLPAKSIGRFRCVSKPWKFLLTHPQFIKTHLNRLRNLEQESLLLLSESHRFYTVTLNDAHHLFDEMPLNPRRLRFAGYPDYWTEVLASYDGLVLVCDKDDNKFLTNPTTRDIKEVPVSPFALDPFASFTMYGLGYDSVNDDYKIVALSYYDTDNENEPDCTEMFVDVYSVRKGTWKKVESSPYDHAVGHVTSGVFLDGYIHWLACSRTTNYPSVITAFNLAEEKFCEVPPPSAVDGEKFVFHHLVVLGGRLSMYHSSYKNDTDMWVMKEYGVQKSWTKYTISDGKGSEYKPMCLVGQEQVVLVKDEETDEKLVMYNLKEGSFKDVVVHGIPDDFHAGGTFMESLLTPHCTDETGRGC